MSLSSGSRLGAYEIVTPLGAGGMGEVYRARDTNLGRDVALKTLPDRVVHDAERLARFRREAQLLAALNHPHIAAIYGLEESAGHRFLVLELVDGETLADRLRRGPLPVDEAVAIAREIAEALQAAHERGIIHRDLKPANIALTSQDRVKILDFGLAKAIDPADSLPPLDSPTITSPAMLTGMGVMLGTAAYMSPEQARGRVADRRSDVWAFGCVLFEMLTARRAFEGDEVSDTVASVLKGEPAWSALPPTVPPSIRSLLAGCLEKDHRQRISDISTASFVLKRTLESPTPPAPLAVTTSTRRALTAALLVLAGAAAAAALFSVLRPQPEAAPAPVARFGIDVADDLQITISRRAVAISPDGTRLVYSSAGKLYVRSLSDFDARPILGADPGIGPEFSPDGSSIVFWGDGLLKRVPVTGGVPVTICSTAPAPFGIQWTDQGIIFSQAAIGVLRVSPNGGTPEVIVRIPPADGLAQGPRLLPDGRSVIYAWSTGRAASLSLWDKATIVQQTIGSTERTTLVQNASDARYVEPGLPFYMVEGSLMAVRFDPAARKVTTGAVPILEGVRRSAASTGYAAHYDVSRTGTLAYVPGPSHAGQEDVYIYDRAGTSLRALDLPRGSYAYPRVSPDGTRIAVESRSAQEAIVALYDLSGGTSLRRLTFGGNNRLPVWSADGKRITFQSDREGDLGIFWQPVDGGTAERLTRAEKDVAHVPESWSRTGDVLLFSATRQNESTLWMFSVRDRKVTQFPDVKSPAFPTNAVFSPDGRWVAYQQGDGTTGEASTYVQPFPPNGTKYEIARGGRPMWSRDGRELFFVPAPSQFRSVSVKTDPAFSFGPPVEVLRRFGLAPPGAPRPYDILPDGRFVVVDVATAANDGRLRGQIDVVLNWFEELRARIPAR